MDLIKVKIPPYYTGQAGDKLCDVTLFVNNQACLYCHSGSVAVFQAERTCITAVLIKDVRANESLPFFRDIVITGILTPGKQYEILQKDYIFELVEAS